MTDAAIERRLWRQHGLVARWQLIDDGIPAATATKRLARLRQVHDGVHLSGHAPLTQHQEALAATLSTPDSMLGHEFAAAFLRLGDEPPDGRVTIVRPGVSSRTNSGRLDIFYAGRIDPRDMTTLRGVPIVAPGRLLIDIAPRTSERNVRRMVRETLRLGIATGDDLIDALTRGRGRRRVQWVRSAVLEYASAPAHRARSGSEVVAWCEITAAGLPEPDLNVVRAGFEADLSWAGRRLIVEVDGAPFHRFPTEDQRRDEAWHSAGWEVLRFPSEIVNREPERLVAAVRELLA